MHTMHSIHICVPVYVCVCSILWPGNVSTAHVFTIHTYMYVICCMSRLPPPAAVVCIYTQLSWAIGPAGPVCVCMCMPYRSICRGDHGLGQIPRWIPTCRRVALYFVCMPRSFLEATMRKNQIDTHAHTQRYAQGVSPAVGGAATVRTRCAALLSNCAAKLLLLLETGRKKETNTTITHIHMYLNMYMCACKYACTYMYVYVYWVRWNQMYF